MKACTEIKPGMCLVDNDGDYSVVTSVSEDYVDVVIVSAKTPWVYAYAKLGFEEHGVCIVSPEELAKALEG